MGRELLSYVSPEIVVTAKLLDKKTCPDSGEKHYGLVMKYKIKKVITGNFSSKEIYVAHGAPELPRFIYFEFNGSLRSFEVGAVHRLRLKEKLEGNASPFDILVDPYLFSEPSAKRYLCIKVDSEPTESTCDEYLAPSTPHYFYQQEDPDPTDSEDIDINYYPLL